MGLDVGVEQQVVSRLEEGLARPWSRVVWGHKDEGGKIPEMGDWVRL